MDLYNVMVRCLSNWGDNKYLKNAPEGDNEAISIYRFGKSTQGYNYAKNFKVEDAENLDGTPKNLLIHHSTGKIVLHHLNVFDTITEAHQKAGHLAIDRMRQMALPTYYSITADLVKMYCNDCYV